jgi:hypothetical protein
MKIIQKAITTQQAMYKFKARIHKKLKNKEILGLFEASVNRGQTPDAKSFFILIKFLSSKQAASSVLFF